MTQVLVLEENTTQERIELVEPGKTKKPTIVVLSPPLVVPGLRVWMQVPIARFRKQRVVIRVKNEQENIVAAARLNLASLLGLYYYLTWALKHILTDYQFSLYERPDKTERDIDIMREIASNIDLYDEMMDHIEELAEIIYGTENPKNNVARIKPALEKFEETERKMLQELES